MVKIAVTSDLHCEMTAEDDLRALAVRIAAERPGLTFLAGDLGTPLEQFVACLTCFAEMPGEVAVLAGNHDVWAAQGHHSQALWEHDLPAATRDAGMLWLEETEWLRDGVAVAGSMAWYDYSAVDPTLQTYSPDHFVHVKGDYNNDARFIDWPWNDQQIAARLGDVLTARLLRLEADRGVRGALVVTHVPVFEAQMVRRSPALPAQQPHKGVPESTWRERKRLDVLRLAHMRQFLLLQIGGTFKVAHTEEPSRSLQPPARFQ